ncbi:MAG: hypothetical protein R3F54_04970 [Alphaproteobacteria bacterium]
MSSIFRSIALVSATVFCLSSAAAAEKDEAYKLSVENATAKVGEATSIKAVLRTVDGYTASKAYNNRLIELSADEKDSVDFADHVVKGKLQDDGSVAFDIGVTPQTPGKHMINGVFRFGFHKEGRMNMLSIPLIAEVDATE